MTLWKRDLDPYITVISVPSSHILPIVLELPGHQTSIHINVYLPTAGKESRYVEELALLEATIENVSETYPNALVYVRGDANSVLQCRKNNKRDKLFKHFCSDHSLEPLSLNHKTYHHFAGQGSSDSNIDVVLQSSISTNGTPVLQNEELREIICRNEDSRLNSHHDVIITSLCLPHIQPDDPEPTTSVPRLVNTRHKIVWADDAIDDYAALVNPALEDLRSACL